MSSLLDDNEELKIDPPEFGEVEITDGPFRGSIGFYDADSPEGAIVYFNDTFEVIPKEYLRNTMKQYQTLYH